MKYISFFFFLWFFLLQWANAAVEDNSIIDELTQNNIQQQDADYQLKTFESCSAFEDVMEEYYKSYWEYNPYNSGRYKSFSMQSQILESETIADLAMNQDESTDWMVRGDFSKTNTQVIGVDEADIVKTDGKYHYYYNQTESAVYIIATSKSWSSDDLKIIKKLHLPKSFYNPELYIDENRLVIIASGYSNIDYASRGFYVNRNTKTYTIVFDTTDIENPELLRLYSSDGDYGKSRKIGDTLYILSRNYMNFPYWDFKSAEDITIDAQKILPRSIDISKTTVSSQQNLVLSWKEYPYTVSISSGSDCSDMSYSLPNKETLKNTSFNPGYNIISAIDISQSGIPVKTKIIAGSNNEIYMSQDNLYLTEWIWSQEDYSCLPDERCAMPFFWWGTQNTLLHKLNIQGQDVVYQNSALIPWAPLNQYSMDEFEWNFRIITSQWAPEASTGLYVLNDALQNVSSLTQLAPWETFQSSRFIGDKLFLVTFEQIDPLFAIDISDIKNPIVLWELKIPWFSTYLHPYDENHLIGLGYDTIENYWWGIETAGVKVDLYKINYDKKCGDTNLTAIQEEKCESGDYKGIIVEQLYSETFGWKWSYSEALSNPRMFVWNKNRKMLLMPATLYERDEEWKTLDYYNGLFAIKIDKDSWIQVQSTTTHIDIVDAEKDRKKDCEKYWEIKKKYICEDLVWWNCELLDSNIPYYCNAQATIWPYIGDHSWEFNNEQIKRTLYIGDEVYAFSDSKIWSYNWSLEQNDSININN